MMRKSMLVVVIGALVACALTVNVAPVLASDDKADAEAMLAEYKAAKAPQFDQARKDDPQYRQEYQAEMRAFMEKRAEMAKAFYDKFPDHADAGKLMAERWMILPRIGQGDLVAQETDAAIAKSPDAPIAKAARFSKAQIAMMTSRDIAEQQQAVEEFIEADPKDPRGGDLLVQLASHGVDDPAKQRELLNRIQKDYPETRAAKAAGAKLRQVDGVGKPFEISFTDAITGKTIDNKSLKGKVVVVDFWATWCGPCVAEMPKMKQLYGEYKDKGVEFVGISLDAPESEGGLDKLKKFVAENQIPWPQYYQGDGWKSEFSSSWGINSIPAIFIVDHEGKLYSTSARGKLEQLIPELIAKRDGKHAKAG
jgi:thiol-disulfide isomerase/thioredoxin